MCRKLEIIEALTYQVMYAGKQEVYTKMSSFNVHGYQKQVIQRNSAFKLFKYCKLCHHCYEHSPDFDHKDINFQTDNLKHRRAPNMEYNIQVACIQIFDH